MRRFFLSLLLLPCLLVAEDINSYQPLQPSRSNYIVRSNSRTQFHYGYPGCVTCAVEPNVVFQLLFDQVSGNLIDTVAALVLVPVGTLDYRQDSSDYSPLMQYSIYNGFTEGAEKTTDTPTIAIGTSDFVFEVVLKVKAGDTPGGELFSTCDKDGVDVGCFSIGWNFSTSAWQINLTATDGTATQTTCVYTAMTTGAWYKLRVAGNRAANVTMKVNGNQICSQSMATLVGKSIPAYGVTVGKRPGAINTSMAYYNEMRLTVGNSTNNSGGFGGG